MRAGLILLQGLMLPGLQAILIIIKNLQIQGIDLQLHKIYMKKERFLLTQALERLRKYFSNSGTALVLSFKQARRKLIISFRNETNCLIIFPVGK